MYKHYLPYLDEDMMEDGFNYDNNDEFDVEIGMCDFENFSEFFPDHLMEFCPDEKDEDIDSTTPAELAKLCSQLKMLLQKCLDNRIHHAAITRSEFEIEDLIKQLMRTTDQVKVECKKQSKKMLTSFLPHARSGPLPSLVVDKIADFLIEDEEVWTTENCKFENVPNQSGKRKRANQVYNELAEIYEDIKLLCNDMCSYQWNGNCEHKYLHEFNFDGVLEAEMTKRRLSDGKLFD